MATPPAFAPTYQTAKIHITETTIKRHAGLLGLAWRVISVRPLWELGYMLSRVRRDSVAFGGKAGQSDR